MASGQGKRSNTGKGAGRKSPSGKSTSGKNRGTAAGRNARQSEPMDLAIKNEVILIGVFALAVFLFLCNFGVVGVMGDMVSGVMFGILGWTSYAAPILFFLAVAFGISNKGNRIAVRKLVAAVLLFLLTAMTCDLLTGSWNGESLYRARDVFERCSVERGGGGLVGGTLAFLSYHFLSMVGTALLILVLVVICLVIITEKSVMKGVKSGGQRVYEKTREDAYYRRERAIRRREEQEQLRRERQEERRLREEAQEDEKILRMDKKVSGVMLDTTLTGKTSKKAEPSTDTAMGAMEVRDDIHEIILNDLGEDDIREVEVKAERRTESGGESVLPPEFDRIHITSAFHQEEETGSGSGQEAEHVPAEAESTDLWDGLDTGTDGYGFPPPDAAESPEEGADARMPGTRRVRPVAKPAAKDVPAGRDDSNAQDIVPVPKKIKEYVFPSVKLLKKSPNKGNGDSAMKLKQTAMQLQTTLATFGVRVTVTDISQGPTVTRYELQPDQGVKVSKIVGLADDIKLNLAATDIRIEAPIPGKAAVGIEVPNKETSAVMLGDLLDSREFKDFSSNLAFAVGKDIGGKTVVTDIAKMPHMLIAGSTGSGKSVCINTLIMSILYKAHPDDVKLIMVDPKVVELSVYNGIPHLMIPVVTDPKKAAAALHWGVAEMTERYKKFADFNVRDLKGYNKAVEAMKGRGEDAPAKMPQIVIIVDELADLMMVSPGEVEESICRLAQLARAAGIHLIIATQRPSVDVITGLIKANMPSRVAFAVSSGVDSRTILDMNGAEKLLGKGDMLFYPQGYPKPARIQGSFVSDQEVSEVVDFLKNQAIGNVYSEDVEAQIKDMGSAVASGGGNGGDGGSYDQYFAEAGRFIIDKDKASIGMLQRVFKIGFNRAARIMDQLCEAGVVGEEEGTKPRKVLMGPEEFEQLVEERV